MRCSILEFFFTNDMKKTGWGTIWTRLGGKIASIGGSKKSGIASIVFLSDLKLLVAGRVARRFVDEG